MKKSILLNLPVELIEKIDEFQKRNLISTRTGAVTELIKRGLNYDKKKTDRSP